MNPPQGQPSRGAHADDASNLAEIAALIHSEYDSPVTVSRVLDSALELVPDADHASLTVRPRREEYVTLGASSTTASGADQLQYTLTEGPCLDAFVEAEWFRSGDISHEQRWPRWGVAAAQLGISSVLSIRLLAQAKPMGSLNLYSNAPGRFTDADNIDLAVLFTTHAAIALTSAQVVTDLQTAVSTRHMIGMAQGILMERYGLNPEGSFAALRRLSSIHNIKVRELAAHIIATREVPLGGKDIKRQPSRSQRGRNP